MAPAILRTVQQADARVPVVYMRTWDQQGAEITGPIRILTILVTLFAIGSLLIAAIGQYAVVSFDVRRRVREFGVRMALGASARQVVTSVLREQSRLTVSGLLCGFALSLVVGGGLDSVLYGITPTDPLTYAAVFTLLATVSLLACYVPARGAARVDPMRALRCE
jgi:ABC-type antimicrobial peptide transport system permease subunit